MDIQLYTPFFRFNGQYINPKMLFRDLKQLTFFVFNVQVISNVNIILVIFYNNAGHHLQKRPIGFLNVTMFVGVIFNEKR